MTTYPIPQIPKPRLQTVRNLTPFASFQCDKMGPGRKFFDVVVVKGTFELRSGVLRLAERQEPVLLADEYWDPKRAEHSSLRRAGEALLVKPSTDLIVTGAARTPTGRPERTWDAGIIAKGRTGIVLDYSVQVTGPRYWQYRNLLGWVLADPQPTCEVSVRYELAYGGAYLGPQHGKQEGRDCQWLVHDPNPSGCGFYNQKALDNQARYQAPQWQLRSQPVTSMNREVPVSGFGPVPRPWSSRYQYAGTYDEAWELKARSDVQSGMPADYPEDFDLRFFQCAHPALITTTYLHGDEHILLSGLVAGRPQFVTRLPAFYLLVSLLDGRGRWREQIMPLDTVTIDLDLECVHLCWRVSLSQERDVRAAVIAVKNWS